MVLPLLRSSRYRLSRSNEKNGNPIGNAPEIKYKVIDLPTWKIGQLVGGTELRLTLGVLKKVTEGTDDDFVEALLPLLDVLDENDQLELTKDVLNLIVKVCAFRGRPLKMDAIHRTLRPIFSGKEEEVIRTIFDEKFQEGEAAGLAKGEALGIAKAEARAMAEKAETILTFLRARFKRVPRAVTEKIRGSRDKVVLDSWAALAANCKSLDEFTEHLL